MDRKWGVAGSIAAIVAVLAGALASYFGLVGEVKELRSELENQSTKISYLADLDGRVSSLEGSMGDVREGRGECAWQNVGYAKSHDHDKERWCPVGSFITQIDLDVVSGVPAVASPMINAVLCCEVAR